MAKISERRNFVWPKMEVVDMGDSSLITGISATGSDQPCGGYDPNDPCPCDGETCSWVGDF